MLRSFLMMWPGFMVEILDEVAKRAGFTWRDSYSLFRDPEKLGKTWTDLVQWQVKSYDMSGGHVCLYLMQVVHTYVAYVCQWSMRVFCAYVVHVCRACEYRAVYARMFCVCCIRVSLSLSLDTHTNTHKHTRTCTFLKGRPHRFQGNGGSRRCNGGRWAYPCSRDFTTPPSSFSRRFRLD